MAVLHPPVLDARPQAAEAAAEADAPLIAAMHALCDLGGTRPTSHFTKLANGKTIHHLEIGVGPPLLLIHGAGGGAANWYRMFAPLSQAHRVLAVDLPGFGLSDAIDPQAPLGEQTAKILDEWLELLISRKARDGDGDRDRDGGAMGGGGGVGTGGPSPSPIPSPPQSPSRSRSPSRAFPVIATSFGALAALRLCQHFPARVDRLVLVDAAGAGREVSSLLRFATLPLLGQMFMQPSRRGTKWLLTGVMTTRRLGRNDEIALTDYLFESARRSSAQLMVRALRAFLRGGRQAEVPTLAELTRVTAPTLIVWGARDRIFSPRHATVLQLRLPDARTVMIDSGHSPNWEAPDELAKALLEFLNE